MIVFVYNFCTYAYETHWSVIISHICLRVWYHLQRLPLSLFSERLQNIVLQYFAVLSKISCLNVYKHSLVIKSQLMYSDFKKGFFFLIITDSVSLKGT